VWFVFFFLVRTPTGPNTGTFAVYLYR